MADCLFCNIIQGKIPADKVYEDAHILVIKDIRPKAKVHLLVIPKLHLDSLLDAEEEHAPLMGYVVTSLKNFAKEQGLNGFRTIVNTGKGSGQEIFHVHFHLLGGGSLPQF